MKGLLENLVEEYVNIEFMQKRLIEDYEEGLENYNSYFNSVMAKNDIVRFINEVDHFGNKKVQKLIEKKKLILKAQNIGDEEE